MESRASQLEKALDTIEEENPDDLKIKTSLATLVKLIAKYLRIVLFIILVYCHILVKRNLDS